MSSIAVSQDEDKAQRQLWIDLNPSKYISKKAELVGDLGVRWDFEEDGWWKVVIRPGVGIPAGSFNVKLGLGNFLTFYETGDNFWELRPYQGISAVWPSRRLSMDHLLRLEERFEFNINNWNSATSLRARYRLRITYKWAAMRAERYWTATGSAELFATLAGSQGLSREQARITAGVDRNFSLQRRIRLEISWQLQEGIFQDDSVDEIYIRLRFYRHF
jgi:hypothetical protein